MSTDLDALSRSSGVLSINDLGIDLSRDDSTIARTDSVSSSVCSTMSVSSSRPFLTRSISLSSVSSPGSIKGVIENSHVFSDVEKNLVFKKIETGFGQDASAKLLSVFQDLEKLVKDNPTEEVAVAKTKEFVSEVMLTEITKFIESNPSLCFSTYETDLLLKEFAKACENPGSHPKVKKLLDECLEKLSDLEARKEVDIKAIKKTLQTFLKENISFKDTLSVAFHEEMKAWKEADKAGKVKIVAGYLMDTFFPPLVFAKKCYDFIKHMSKNPEQWAKAKQKIAEFFKNPSLGYEARKALAKTLINIGISGLIGVLTAAIVFSGGISIPFLIAFAVTLGMGLVATTVNDKQENKSFVVTLAETSNIVITNTFESMFSTLPNPGLTPFMRTFAMTTNFTGPGFDVLRGPVHDMLTNKLKSEKEISQQADKEKVESVDWSFPGEFGFCGYN